eukprot:13581180-Alexandrium_andersonii.AAC.1
MAAISALSPARTRCKQQLRVRDPCNDEQHTWQCVGWQSTTHIVETCGICGFNCFNQYCEMSAA